MRRLLVTAFLLSLFGIIPVDAADKDEKPKDTEKAAATRKALDSKITIDWKDEKLQDALEELAKKISEASKTEVKTFIDSNGSGVTRNAKVTYSAKDKPVKEMLDEFCKKYDYGYLIIPGSYSAGKKVPVYPAKDKDKDGKPKWDGVLLITKGTERGYVDPEKK